LKSVENEISKKKTLDSAEQSGAGRIKFQKLSREVKITCKLLGFFERVLKKVVKSYIF
jgi:hypothetical protein